MAQVSPLDEFQAELLAVQRRVVQLARPAPLSAFTGSLAQPTTLPTSDMQHIEKMLNLYRKKLSTTDFLTAAIPWAAKLQRLGLASQACAWVITPALQRLPAAPTQPDSLALYCQCCTVLAWSLLDSCAGISAAGQRAALPRVLAAADCAWLAVGAVATVEASTREALYWHAYNASVALCAAMELGTRLDGGQIIAPPDTADDAVHTPNAFQLACAQYAAGVSAAMTTIPNLCTPRFLPWRVRWWCMGAQAAASSGSMRAGLVLLDDGLRAVAQLQREVDMDPPVPAPLVVRLDAARAALQVCKLALCATAAPLAAFAKAAAIFHSAAPAAAAAVQALTWADRAASSGASLAVRGHLWRQFMASAQPALLAALALWHNAIVDAGYVESRLSLPVAAAGDDEPAGTGSAPAAVATDSVQAALRTLPLGVHTAAFLLAWEQGHAAAAAVLCAALEARLALALESQLIACSDDALVSVRPSGLLLPDDAVAAWVQQTGAITMFAGSSSLRPALAGLSAEGAGTAGMSATVPDMGVPTVGATLAAGWTRVSDDAAACAALVSAAQATRLYRGLTEAELGTSAWLQLLNTGVHALAAGAGAASGSGSSKPSSRKASPRKSASAPASAEPVPGSFAGAFQALCAALSQGAGAAAPLPGLGVHAAAIRGLVAATKACIAPSAGGAAQPGLLVHPTQVQLAIAALLRFGNAGAAWLEAGHANAGRAQNLSASSAAEVLQVRQMVQQTLACAVRAGTRLVHLGLMPSKASWVQPLLLASLRASKLTAEAGEHVLAVTLLRDAHALLSIARDHAVAPGTAALASTQPGGSAQPATASGELSSSATARFMDAHVRILAERVQLPYPQPPVQPSAAPGAGAARDGRAPVHELVAAKHASVAQLACIEADLLYMLFCTELALNARMRRQAKVAAAQRAQLKAKATAAAAETATTKLVQGTTKRVRAKDAVPAEEAAQVAAADPALRFPVEPDVYIVSRLRSECHRNPQWLALLHLALVQFRRSAGSRLAELQAASSALQAAPAVLALPSAGSSGAPAIACRSSTAITLRHAGEDRDDKHIVLLGKVWGSGTAVAATCNTLQGTNVVLQRQDGSGGLLQQAVQAVRQGTDVEPPGARAARQATASGLTRNELYNFAWAEYTGDRTSVHAPVPAELRVGSSTAAVLAAHPLPNALLWAYVAQTAAGISEWPSAAAAAAKAVRPWLHVTAPTPSTPAHHVLRLKSAAVRCTPREAIPALARCLLILSQAKYTGAGSPAAWKVPLPTAQPSSAASAPGAQLSAASSPVLAVDNIMAGGEGIGAGQSAQGDSKRAEDDAAADALEKFGTGASQGGKPFTLHQHLEALALAWAALDSSAAPAASAQVQAAAAAWLHVDAMPALARAQTAALSRAHSAVLSGIMALAAEEYALAATAAGVAWTALQSTLAARGNSLEPAIGTLRAAVHLLAGIPLECWSAGVYAVWAGLVAALGVATAAGEAMPLPIPALRAGAAAARASMPSVLLEVRPSGPKPAVRTCIAAASGSTLFQSMSASGLPAQLGADLQQLAWPGVNGPSSLTMAIAVPQRALAAVLHAAFNVWGVHEPDRAWLSSSIVHPAALACWLCAASDVQEVLAPRAVSNPASARGAAAGLQAPGLVSEVAALCDAMGFAWGVGEAAQAAAQAVLDDAASMAPAGAGSKSGKSSSKASAGGSKGSASKGKGKGKASSEELELEQAAAAAAAAEAAAISAFEDRQTLGSHVEQHQASLLIAAQAWATTRQCPAAGIAFVLRLLAAQLNSMGQQSQPDGSDQPSVPAVEPASILSIVQLLVRVLATARATGHLVSSLDGEARNGEAGVVLQELVAALELCHEAAAQSAAAAAPAVPSTIATAVHAAVSACALVCKPLAASASPASTPGSAQPSPRAARGAKGSKKSPRGASSTGTVPGTPEPIWADRQAGFVLSTVAQAVDSVLCAPVLDKSVWPLEVQQILAAEQLLCAAPEELLSQHAVEQRGANALGGYQDGGAGTPAAGQAGDTAARDLVFSSDAAGQPHEEHVAAGPSISWHRVTGLDASSLKPAARVQLLWLAHLALQAADGASQLLGALAEQAPTQWAASAAGRKGATVTEVAGAHAFPGLATGAARSASAHIALARSHAGPHALSAAAGLDGPDAAVEFDLALLADVAAATASVEAAAAAWIPRWLLEMEDDMHNDVLANDLVPKAPVTAAAAAAVPDTDVAPPLPSSEAARPAQRDVLLWQSLLYASKAGVRARACCAWTVVVSTLQTAWKSICCAWLSPANLGALARRAVPACAPLPALDPALAAALGVEVTANPDADTCAPVAQAAGVAWRLGVVAVELLLAAGSLVGRAGAGSSLAELLWGHGDSSASLAGGLAAGGGGLDYTGQETPASGAGGSDGVPSGITPAALLVVAKVLRWAARASLCLGALDNAVDLALRLHSVHTSMESLFQVPAAMSAPPGRQPWASAAGAVVNDGDSLAGMTPGQPASASGWPAAMAAVSPSEAAASAGEHTGSTWASQLAEHAVANAASDAAQPNPPGAARGQTLAVHAVSDVLATVLECGSIAASAGHARARVWQEAAEQTQQLLQHRLDALVAADPRRRRRSSKLVHVDMPDTALQAAVRAACAARAAACQGWLGRTSAWLARESLLEDMLAEQARHMPSTRTAMAAARGMTRQLVWSAARAALAAAADTSSADLAEWELGSAPLIESAVLQCLVTPSETAACCGMPLLGDALQLDEGPVAVAGGGAGLRALRDQQRASPIAAGGSSMALQPSALPAAQHPAVLFGVAHSDVQALQARRGKPLPPALPPAAAAAPPIIIGSPAILSSAAAALAEGVAAACTPVWRTVNPEQLMSRARQQYLKCAALLREQRETPTLVACLLAAGDLAAMAGSSREAASLWEDALDAAFSAVSCLSSGAWRSLLADMLPHAPGAAAGRALPAANRAHAGVLAMLGEPGLLLCGVLAARLAEHAPGLAPADRQGAWLVAAHMFAGLLERDAASSGAPGLASQWVARIPAASIWSSAASVIWDDSLCSAPTCLHAMLATLQALGSHGAAAAHVNILAPLAAAAEGFCGAVLGPAHAGSLAVVRAMRARAAAALGAMTCATWHLRRAVQLCSPARPSSARDLPLFNELQAWNSAHNRAVLGWIAAATNQPEDLPPAQLSIGALSPAVYCAVSLARAEIAMALSAGAAAAWDTADTVVADEARQAALAGAIPPLSDLHAQPTPIASPAAASPRSGQQTARSQPGANKSAREQASAPGSGRSAAELSAAEAWEHRSAVLRAAEGLALSELLRAGISVSVDGVVAVLPSSQQEQGAELPAGALVDALLVVLGSRAGQCLYVQALNVACGVLRMLMALDEDAGGAACCAHPTWQDLPQHVAGLPKDVVGALFSVAAGHELPGLSSAWASAEHAVTSQAAHAAGWTQAARSVSLWQWATARNAVTWALLACQCYTAASLSAAGTLAELRSASAATCHMSAAYLLAARVQAEVGSPEDVVTCLSAVRAADAQLHPASTDSLRSAAVAQQGAALVSGVVPGLAGLTIASIDAMQYARSVLIQVQYEQAVAPVAAQHAASDASFTYRQQCAERVKLGEEDDASGMDDPGRRLLLAQRRQHISLLRAALAAVQYRLAATHGTGFVNSAPWAAVNAGASASMACRYDPALPMFAALCYELARAIWAGSTGSELQPACSDAGTQSGPQLVIDEAQARSCVQLLRHATAAAQASALATSHFAARVHMDLAMVLQCVSDCAPACAEQALHALHAARLHAARATPHDAQLSAQVWAGYAAWHARQGHMEQAAASTLLAAACSSAHTARHMDTLPDLTQLQVPAAAAAGSKGKPNSARGAKGKEPGAPVDGVATQALPAWLAQQLQVAQAAGVAQNKLVHSLAIGQVPNAVVPVQPADVSVPDSVPLARVIATWRALVCREVVMPMAGMAGLDLVSLAWDDGLPAWQAAHLQQASLQPVQPCWIPVASAVPVQSHHAASELDMQATAQAMTAQEQAVAELELGAALDEKQCTVWHCAQANAGASEWQVDPPALRAGQASLAWLAAPPGTWLLEPTAYACRPVVVARATNSSLYVQLLWVNHEWLSELRGLVDGWRHLGMSEPSAFVQGKALQVARCLQVVRGALCGDMAEQDGEDAETGGKEAEEAETKHESGDKVSPVLAVDIAHALASLASFCRAQTGVVAL